MKTRMIITAAAIIFSVSFATASSQGKNLIFKDGLGRTLIQPVKPEEACEPLPNEVEACFSSKCQGSASQVFDLSELMRPEEEEPLPFDLKKMFKTAKK